MCFSFFLSTDNRGSPVLKCVGFIWVLQGNNTFQKGTSLKGSVFFPSKGRFSPSSLDEIYYFGLCLKVDNSDRR